MHPNPGYIGFRLSSIIILLFISACGGSSTVNNPAPVNQQPGTAATASPSPSPILTVLPIPGPTITIVNPTVWVQIKEVWNCQTSRMRMNCEGGGSITILNNGAFTITRTYATK